MVSNYFFLNRLIKSEAQTLKNSLLTRITSQDVNTFIFAFTTQEEKERFWEVKLDGLPYLIPRSKFSAAKKNYAVFYHNYLPSPVVSLGITGGDRIFRIRLTTGDIVFFFKGNGSKILFRTADGMVYDNRFVLEPENEFSRYFEYEYSSEPWFPALSADSQPDDSGKYNLKKIFVGFGKEIQEEYELRCEQNPDHGALIHLSDILNEVYTSEMALSLTAEGDYTFIPTGFKSVKLPEIDTVFSEPADILTYLIKENHRRKNFVAMRKDMVNRIDEKIRFFTKKIENTSVYLKDAAMPALYKLYADLLLVNREKLQPGMTGLEINDIISNSGMLKIPMKEDLTPQQNIDNYYKKSRNSEIALKRAQEQIPHLQMNLLRFTKIKDKILNTTDIEELKNIAAALGMSKETKKEQAADGSQFRRYIIDDKYKLYVGKDSHSNDELTVRFANQNDIWFHARSVPGSHVVLRSEDGKSGIPKDIIKKAASVAAFYSKAKTAKLAPVSYTEKKYVVKRKGLNPGQVLLLKEQSLIVPPEIPVGCVPVGSDNDI